METKKRVKKVYNDEFKIQAVERLKLVGRKKTCEELGISHSALDRWKHEFGDNTASDSTEKPSYKQLEKENARLKRELGYVEEINRILKKSTAIFSSDQVRGLK